MFFLFFFLFSFGREKNTGDLLVESSRRDIQLLWSFRETLRQGRNLSELLEELER